MDSESYLAALCRAVPYHIVEPVLEDPTEASLAYRDVAGSVLIADLVSFTSMCERIARPGPDRLGRLSIVLNELFSSLELQAFFPYGGYVVEFGGDAITAAFQGPDHVRRCAAAALMCQQVVARVSGGDLGKEASDLRLRVGVSTGQVHFAVLGDLTRRFGLCSGTPAHHAIGLQQRVAPGEIAIDDATARELQGIAEVRVDAGRATRLVALHSYPPPQPLKPLGRRIQENVPEKIAMLEPFVAAPLAQRLRSLPGGWQIDAEIRRPIVLFAEITGYNEDVRYFDVAIRLSRSLLRAFHKYDGLILKATTTEHGHRVMVLFGLHHPTEHDAEKAVLASLEAVTRVRGYQGVPSMSLAMRVGIHSGPVYFGAIGSQHKHDLTAIGDTVNAAARVCTLAAPFEVMVTQTVLEKCRDAFVHSARGPMKLKGKDDPISLSAVHGPAEGRAHYARRRAHRRFTCGRRKQMEQLQAAADAALDGRGRMVGVTGDEGTGKSHLLANLIDEWVGRGGVAVVTRCRFATRATPLGPVRDLFAAITGATPDESEASRAARLHQYISGMKLGVPVAELVALLQPVRRPDGFDETLIDIADLQARDRLVGALVQILNRRVTASQTPLLYAVEDMHHADSLTLELASRLAALPRDRPFLLVGTWRRDPMVAILERCLDHLIVLEPLDLAATTELIAREMRAVHVEPTLAEFLWRRTGGNGEHLVQTVRFLADRLLLSVRGETVVSPAPWRERLEDLVPPRWEHVALARLDGLNEVERRVLRTASAIGSAFGQEVLENTVGDLLDPEVVSDALAALESHQIFTTDASSGSWRFRDDATRAIAYAVIPVDERAEVHRRIADVLESGSSERKESMAAAIGHHRERANQLREAMRWYAMVAHMAFRAGLEAESRLYAEKWEHLQGQLSGDDAINERDAPWIAVIRLYLTADAEKPKEALARAVEVLRKHRRAMGTAAAEVTRYTIARSRQALGDLRRARTALKRVSGRTQMTSIAFEAALSLGQLAEWTGQLQEGLAYAADADQRAGDRLYNRLRIELLRAWLQLSAGRPERARSVFGEVRSEALNSEHPRLRGAASDGLGMCALLDGRLEDAVNAFDEALRVAHATGNLRHEATALVRKGASLLFAGRFQESLVPLEGSAGIMPERGHVRLDAERQVHLGAAIAHTRDLGEGIDLCESGLRLARASNLWLPMMMGALHLYALRTMTGEAERAAQHRAEISDLQRRGYALIRSAVGG